MPDGGDILMVRIDLLKEETVASPEESVSLRIALKDVHEVSSVVEALGTRPTHDSVRVAISGTRSSAIRMIESLGDRAVRVSAVITLKGDVPAG